MVPHGTLWGVTGALYGLAESPGDWTDYRDQQLGAIEHPTPQGQLWLQQVAESKLWRIMLDDSSQGFLGTYVDDLLVSGSAWIVEQTLAKIASIWECSTPEVLDAEKFEAGKHPPEHYEELRF